MGENLIEIKIEIENQIEMGFLLRRNDKIAEVVGEIEDSTQLIAFD